MPSRHLVRLSKGRLWAAALLLTIVSATGAVGQDKHPSADRYRLAQEAASALRGGQRAPAEAAAQRDLRAIGPNVKVEVQRTPPLSAAQRADHGARLQGHLQALRQGQVATRSELQATAADLRRRNAPTVMLERQQVAQAQFDQRAAEFDRLSAAWLQSQSDANLGALTDFFDKYPAQRKAAPFDPKALTWGSPKPTTRQPAATKTAWFQQLWGRHAVRTAQAANVGPINFQIPPEPGQMPTEADLAPTPEATRSAAIVAQATALNRNPVAIHNWVRNTIEWVPTWGAVQSADDTLTKRRGNAHDIASLEIALLRAADIPARYQYGTIEVDADKLANWVGGASGPEAAQQLLGQGGIANRAITNAGRIVRVQMEHVWVSAFVNWAPSRGARQGSSTQHVNPVGPHNSWVALDASYKQHADSAGAGLVDALSLNARGVIDTAKQAGLCTPDSAARLDAASLQSAFTQAQSRLDTAAAAAGTDATIAQLLGSRSLVGVAPSMLGANPAYSVVSDVTSAVAVPDGVRWRVRWSLFASDADVAGDIAVARLDSHWHALARQRVSLSFVPATQADADLIASYLPPAHADGSPVLAGEWPANLPAYLVRMRAELRVEGQLIASGGEFILGSELPAAMAVYDPGTQAWTQTALRVRAGETHVLVPDAHDIGGDELVQAKTRWANLLAALPGGTTSEALAGEALRQLALGYLATADANARVFQRGGSVVHWRLPSLARAFTPAAATVNYGIITQVRFGGVALGVDRLLSAVAARRDGANVLAYQRQDLMRSAAQGHLMLERLLADGATVTPAASAIKVLALAGSSTDNPVLQLDAANATTLAAQVQTDAATRDGLVQAALGGTVVRVPRQGVAVGGQSSLAAMLDDGQGAGAYLMLDGSRSHLATQAGAGGIGWLALAAPAQRPVAVHWLALTVPALHDAAIDVLTPGSEGNRWSALPMRAEVANGALLSALAAAVSAQPCEAVVPLLAAGLNASVGLGADGSALAAPPVFDSVPPTAAIAGQSYQYAPSVRDPQNLATTLRLVGAPSGMVLGADRTVRWASPTLGTHVVTVRADNGRAVADQRYELVVGNGAQPLELGVALTPTVVNAGQTVNLVAFANGGRGNVALSATLNGQPLALDATGAAAITAGASGSYRIVVRATDAAETLERQVIYTVRDAGDTSAPQAAITAPAADTEVTGLLDVLGSASDANLAYYQLRLRPAGAGDSAWKEIARGTSSVTAGLLGRLDARTLANGVYELGLRVVDINGAETSALVPIEVARDLKLGQFRLAFADIRADLQGVPLVLTRSYDSTQREVNGDFGWGWRAASQDVSVRKNMVLGLQWDVQAQGLELCLRAVGQRRVTVQLPDGGLYRFRARNLSECGFGQIPPVSIVFDPLPLPVGGGSGRASGGGQLEVLNGGAVQAQGGQLIDSEGNPWNPLDYRFTSPEGMVYVLREGVGVLRVTDPYGNTVDYGPNGYQHSANVGISFTRDASGRITRATDPAGRSVAYAYNAAGELASVTDREGRITRFEYGRASRLTEAGSVIQAHLLAAIIDPDGKVIASQSFDEYGRLAASRDAAGHQTQLTYDEANNRQTVTDRRGNATTYTFDAAGNITRVVDARGGVTDLTYDANGNELTRRNPLGHTVTKTFDLGTGLPLTESNHLGQTNSTTYVSGAFPQQRQNPLTTTDARGAVTNYSYRAGQDQMPGAVPDEITEPLGRTTLIGQATNGNLTSLNVAGIATSYAYDAQGRRTSETDGAGATTTYTYDVNGNELTRTVTRTVGGQPRTETTTRRYDAENRVIEETDPAGATRRTTYNAAGKVATSTDALGRITRYAYDGNARLTRTEHPDGTSEAIEYDANGNEASRTDRQGRVTRMAYDELDRLITTTHPDGTTQSTEYDAAGRVTASVDAGGARTTYEYDAANRQTAMADASGRRTEYRYDANGNRTHVRTPDGRESVTTYDALNRATRIEQPDGSAHVIVYRADGRKQSETDPRGVTTTYGYDAAGRLTSVQQSGITQATAYAWDQTGAKTTQTDALNRSVTWAFDAAGRPTSRTLPDGQQERFEYDLEGQLSAQVTFGGQRIAHGYDSAGRPTTRITPAAGAAAARTDAWTHDAEGRRLTQTESGANSSQGQTRYRYDAQGRLVELATPQGILSWAYDAAGRITQRTTSEGTTRYAYDGDGRLQTLIAPDGRSTGYAYDAAGRLIRSEQQLDGTDRLITERRYDTADRQVVVAHSRQTGSGTTLVAGQAISRGAGGAVSRIDSFDGTASFSAATGAFSGSPMRVQLFGYDANARLQSEREVKGAQLAAWLADNNQPVTQSITYGYDAVGNRSSKAVTTPSGTESTTYGYDANDRLTSETLTTATGSTVTTTFAWDSNGNLQSKTTPSEYTGYVFDAQNRLVEVRRGATSASATTVASYGHDADGQRVRKQAGSATTQYLIDPTTTWPQVALETTGTQRTAYTWGAELRQQTSGNAGSTAAAPSQALIPLSGHLGTTIAAIDRAGTLVERYEASAFGELQGQMPQARHQYTGEYWDADARLVYLRARWYEPASGRFLSVDPAQGRQTDARSLNRYAYAHSDPLSGVDPSGRELSLGGTMTALSSLALNLTVRVTVLAAQYPRLTGVAGFLAGIFLPMELGPGSNLAASLGQASTLAMQSGVRHLSRTAQEFARNGNFIGQGDEFERAVAAILRIQKNASPVHVRMPDGRLVSVVPDFYWGAKILEVKTSGGAINLEQAARLAELAKQRGMDLVYVFYRRPSDAEISRLVRRIEEEVGVEAAERLVINYLFH